MPELQLFTPFLEGSYNVEKERLVIARPGRKGGANSEHWEQGGLGFRGLLS